MNKELVDYFIQETDKKFDRVEVRLVLVDEKLDLLFKFKWQIIGGAGFASFLITVLIEVIGHSWIH